MKRYDLRSGKTSGSRKETEAMSPWEWSSTMSVPERAILEMMDNLPHHESFHQVDDHARELSRSQVLQPRLKDIRQALEEFAGMTSEGT